MVGIQRDFCQRIGCYNLIGFKNVENNSGKVTVFRLFLSSRQFLLDMRWLGFSKILLSMTYASGADWFWKFEKQRWSTVRLDKTT